VLLVECHISAKKSLKKLLAIEKKMGRKRLESSTFTSRLIDIDILFFDNECIDSKTLKVPHPEIQNRKFVLQPLVDIHSDFVHPKMKLKVSELLSNTKDESVLEKQSKWLRNPIKDFDISKFRYLAIEGNIGAGKTSLATKMASDLNAKLILERFKENPFLPKFYEDASRFAFPLEMSFLADRYQQLLEDIKQHDLFNDIVIADYDAYKSLIFAKITLQDEEFSLYKKLFHLMHKELPKPDVYVYLYQNTERLLANIKKRGRVFEQGINSSYLQKINEGYLEFIKNQHDDSIKIIDISNKDFIENREDYLELLKEILN
jgi:deoxyguanosine kinase